MNLRTAAACLLALALAGCANTHRGTIVEKEYEPAKTKHSCTTSHGKRACTSKKTPECWEIEYRTDSGDEEEVCVSRREYDRYQVGQRYP